MNCHNCSAPKMNLYDTRCSYCQTLYVGETKAKPNKMDKLRGDGMRYEKLENKQIESDGSRFGTLINCTLKGDGNRVDLAIDCTIKGDGNNIKSFRGSTTVNGDGNRVGY